MKLLGLEKFEVLKNPAQGLKAPSLSSFHALFIIEL